MSFTIAAVLAAHHSGRPLVATLEETYARSARHADPALFITQRPEAEARAIASYLAKAY